MLAPKPYLRCPFNEPRASDTTAYRALLYYYYYYYLLLLSASQENLGAILRSRNSTTVQQPPLPCFHYINVSDKPKNWWTPLPSCQHCCYPFLVFLWGCPTAPCGRRSRPAPADWAHRIWWVSPVKKWLLLDKWWICCADTSPLVIECL